LEKKQQPKKVKTIGSGQSVETGGRRPSRSFGQDSGKTNKFQGTYSGRKGTRPQKRMGTKKKTFKGGQTGQVILAATGGGEGKRGEKKGQQTTSEREFYDQLSGRTNN